MLKGLLSLINVVEGEERPVLLILGMGFFMGIFLATYKIVATTLFLHDQVLVQNLREAFFISGILGVISTGLYATLQKRLHFRTLIIVSFVSVFLFIAAVRFSFSFGGDLRQLKYALFVMLTPITSVIILGFWGVFIRLFDLGQSKRIIGRIDSGQLIAFIIATYTVPLLTSVISDITNFLIIGEISMVVCIGFVISIVSIYRLTSFHHGGKSRPVEAKYKNLIKKPYVVSLAFFIFFSMVANTFMDYSFLNVTEQQYPDEKQLASFLGVFEGSVMIIGLFLQTFVNDPLIRNFGLRTPILILPFLLLIFTSLAIFSGHYFGYTLENDQFIWFFLFVVISNLFTKTLREATENPIFKLFFMPLDKRIRFDAQAKIEGIFVEFARATAAGLILLLGFLPTFKLINYSWILILVVIGWVYQAFSIYSKYRKELEKILEPHEEDGTDQKQNITDTKAYLLAKLDDAIANGSAQSRIFALNVVSKVAPYLYREKMKDLQSAVEDRTNDSEVEVIKHDLAYLEVFSNGLDTNNQLSGTKASNESGKDEDLQQLRESENPEDRMLLASLVSKKSDDTFGIIVDLINDNDINVTRSALMAVGKIRDPEFLPFLVESLQNKNLRDPAIESLIQYGEEAVPALENLFYNADQNVDLQKRIVQIYGAMGERAIEIGNVHTRMQQILENQLWIKLNHPNRKIVSEVLVALGKCDFTADEQQSDILHDIIESDIENLVWNFKAITELREAEDESFTSVINGISEDIAQGYNHIYLLLLLFFNKESVQLVKENIESRTAENFSYALELLDVLFEEFKKPKELKEKIIPLLDDISEFDKIRRLGKYYPHSTLTTPHIIKQLINRDLNYTNRWTKTCAIEYVLEKGLLEEFKMEILANLFNPDELLSEIAAFSIYKKDPGLFESYMHRLDRNKQDHLKNIMIGQKYIQSLKLRPHMKYEIIKFLKLKTKLGILSYPVITNMADIIEEIYLESDNYVDLEVWDVQSIHVLYKGKLLLRDASGSLIKSFGQSDILGEEINFQIRRKQFNFKVEEDAVLLKIEKHDFYEFVTSNYEISDLVLQSFD